jgi:hypothetical protein
MGFIKKKSLLRGRYALSHEPKCLFRSERKSYRFNTTNRQYFLNFYQATLLKTAVSDSSFFVASLEERYFFL